MRWGVIWVVLLGLLSACRDVDPHDPQALIDTLIEACAQSDAGALLVKVDRLYRDDRGGPGRLGDDLRQLFTVYGSLRLEVLDVRRDGEELRGHLRVEARGLHFDGPMAWKTVDQPDELRLAGGFLTELRALVWVMRDRRQALEQASVDWLGKLISLEYRGEVGGWKELLERVRQDLASMRGVGMMVHDLRLEVAGETARATQDYSLVFQVEGQGEAKEHRARERLQLRREGTRWRIAGGLG